MRAYVGIEGNHKEIRLTGCRKPWKAVLRCTKERRNSRTWGRYCLCSAVCNKTPDLYRARTLFAYVSIQRKHRPARTRFRKLEGEKCRVRDLTGSQLCMRWTHVRIVASIIATFRSYVHVQSCPRHKIPKEPYVFIIRYQARPAASLPLSCSVINQP